MSNNMIASELFVIKFFIIFNIQHKRAIINSSFEYHCRYRLHITFSPVKEWKFRKTRAFCLTKMKHLFKWISINLKLLRTCMNRWGVIFKMLNYSTILSTFVQPFIKFHLIIIILKLIRFIKFSTHM